MQLMMKIIQMHYNTVPYGNFQDHVVCQDYGGRGYHGNQSPVEDNAVQKTPGIGAEDVVVEPTVILHVNVGYTECVPIRAKTAVPYQMAS